MGKNKLYFHFSYENRVFSDFSSFLQLFLFRICIIFSLLYYFVALGKSIFQNEPGRLIFLNTAVWKNLWNCFTAVRNLLGLLLFFWIYQFRPVTTSNYWSKLIQTVLVWLWLFSKGNKNNFELSSLSSHCLTAMFQTYYTLLFVLLFDI